MFSALHALPLQCPPSYPVLCYPLCAAVFPAVPIALRLLTLCPQVTLHCRPAPVIHSLDIYLPFVPPCTQLCPSSALILTPDLCLDPSVQPFPLTSPFSAICALFFFLPSSAIHLALPCPPLWALRYAQGKPSAMACPGAPFAMPFICSEQPYLLP